MKGLKRFLLLTLGTILSTGLFAQSTASYTLSGTIIDKSTGEPVEFATVLVEATEQWAVADMKGRFTIKGIKATKSRVIVSCLGYVDDVKEIVINRNIETYRIQLSPDNLSIANAGVTAQENSNSATTSRMIDKTALEHVQLMNVSDVSSLLPGGATSNPTLTSEQQIAIRAGSGESGSASFGTAIEVDGVRLSSNASFTNFDLSGRSGSVKGAPTNNIASSNVESVEVITGVPSVEYGDMTSGVVKINTKKGKTPWQLTMSTSPKTKQVSLSKGFGLGISDKGRPKGVLNTSVEYTRSVSEPMSPYTSYDRKQLSLTYSNFFSDGVWNRSPMRITASVSGNVGGLDDRADPDKRANTWLIKRDNIVRGSLHADWLLSRTWITNLEFNGSISYGDKLERENRYFVSTTTSEALHARESGYYIPVEYSETGNNDAVLLPKGTFYNTMAVDDRPLNAKLTMKANWAKNMGRVNNKLKVGTDWTLDKNFGIGQYSEDLSLAPSFREWRFCDVPAMQNMGIYIEDNLLIPTGKDSRLNIIAGLRNDRTMIPGSAYGTTSSISPRFNTKWTILSAKSRRDRIVRELAVRGSWGVAVKQPSFSVLYPTPSYFDINVFTSTTDANNMAFKGYYVMPRSIDYNPALRWQRNRQAEMGIDADIAGNRISLALFRSTTLDSYNQGVDYDRFTYKYTATTSVQGLSIPAENRIYTLDPVDGSVTVSDKTGTQPSITAANSLRKQFVSRCFEDNDDNPIHRYGLEWVVDFKRINPINTTIRLDGTFYGYRSVYTDVVAYCPTTSMSADGSLYKYVGWYVGGNGNSNGQETKSIKTNLTVVTHVPQVRLIVSLKLESCLMRYSRALSENSDGTARSYALANREDITSVTDESVYDRRGYSVTYPLYYTSYDDPAPRPFFEDYMAAKNNDNDLYSDLSKLVVANTTYEYTFLRDWMTPYFSANISITKEIRDIASVSFYANNFFNNLGQVYSTKSGNWSSVSSYIPNFYYGLTVRVKF